jgi:hypothetical protein
VKFNSCEADYSTTLNEIKSLSTKNYNALMAFKNPASIMRFPRLLLQENGDVPPTYGRVASFAEQGMAKNVTIREEHPVISIMDYIKDASVFYSKQVQLYNQGNCLYDVLHHANS